MTKPSRRVQIGTITAAHGIKGQVSIYSLLSPPEIISELKALGDEHGSKQYDLRITGRKKNLFIASIKGIETRNDAESLKNIALFAQIDDPALPAQNAMIDMQVKTVDGKAYGTITDVYNFGAGDVVEIEKPDGEQEMIPLNSGFLIIKDNIAIIIPPEYVETKKE